MILNEFVSLTAKWDQNQKSKKNKKKTAPLKNRIIIVSKWWISNIVISGWFNSLGIGIKQQFEKNQFNRQSLRKGDIIPKIEGINY
jgi:hypothetical protein